MSQRGAAIMVAAGGVALSCVALGFAIVVWCAPYSEYPHAARIDRLHDGAFVLTAFAQFLWTFFALATVALPPDELPRWMRPKAATTTAPTTARRAAAFTLAMGIGCACTAGSVALSITAIGMSDKPLLQTPAFRSLPLGMCLITQFLGIFALRLNRPSRLQPAVA